MFSKNNLYLFIVLCLLSISGRAQNPDTVRVMTYNLLNYPTSSNITTKNTYLSTITNYLQPDILGVVELQNDSAYADNLLANVLNNGGSSNFSRANFSCTEGSDICNMLFYNNLLFGLKTQIVIPYPALREMNHYVLFYRSPDLAVTHDTIFLNVIIAHFKSSQGFESERNLMANTAMQYLNNSPYAPDNFIFMGDLNLYTGTEPAYQTLVNYGNNPAIRFNDPLAFVPLNWHDNSAVAPYHTQSTRTTGFSDFGATGGLDDRFDFQFISGSILNQTNRIGLVPNSYHAPGQDGLHFNGNLINPTNNSAPSNVINALYNMSDHLPVVADYFINYNAPLSATIAAEGSTTFCQGSGSVVLSANMGTIYNYQWQQNGQNIPGANNATYTATEAGVYTVQITANGVTVTSNAITTAIIPAPQPVISGSLIVCAQTIGNYSVPFVAGHLYQWSVGANGTIISGQGTNSISIQWSSGTAGYVSVTEIAP